MSPIPSSTLFKPDPNDTALLAIRPSPSCVADLPRDYSSRFVWDGSALHHTFDLPLDASQGQPIRAVTLEVLNNTGDPHHACLYRYASTRASFGESS